MKVALSAGHHNSDGGNAVEYSITGPLTEAYARAFKAAGWDVRVITPDGPDPDTEPGDGMFPGGLQGAARKVVEWSNAGWVADLYLESHTEGVGDPNVRGVFGIYPNMGLDNKPASNMKLCRAAALAISAASGLPLRGSGIMGESETGVGLRGDRLGIFFATTSVRATTNRIIIEHGSHSSPLDLAILRSPGMFDKIAVAAVQAFNNFYGFNPAPAPPPVITFTQTDKIIGGAFRDRWLTYTPVYSLPENGLPLTNEFDIDLSGKKRTVQLFERKAWIFQPEETNEWRVVSANFDDLALIVSFARINHLF